MSEEKKVIVYQLVESPKYVDKTILPVKISSPIRFYQKEGSTIQFREGSSTLEAEETKTKSMRQTGNQAESNNYTIQSDMDVKRGDPKSLTRRKEVTIEFTQKTQ